MPADTNPAGDIFGGWLMSQMDLAAGNMAGRVSKGRGATVAVEAMQFLRPVKVGDEVTLYATLISVGRSSMRIHVDVWARPRFGDVSQKVTAADFVFVALDDEGRPREIEGS
ncbi:MAG: acyl-CoA thioesterase [Pseudomonadota bacterium]